MTSMVVSLSSGRLAQRDRRGWRRNDPASPGLHPGTIRDWSTTHGDAPIMLEDVFGTS